jgi:hypothetical protein
MDTKSLLFTLGIHFNPESQGQTESSGTVAQEERLFPIFLQTTYPGKNSSLAQQCPTGHESVLLLISHQSVTTFTVIDDDKGSNGQVKCSVLQPPFFRIKKIDDNTFNMVVASSLRTLSPQTVLTILICEDGGNNALLKFLTPFLLDNLMMLILVYP